jgi:hypothetical protein
MRQAYRRLLVSMALVAVLAIAAVALAQSAYAADPHTGGTTGQPSQSCQAFFPNGALLPKGFNTSGFAHATTRYAGSQPQNSRNPHSVAQYDVACFQHAAHAATH